MTLDADATRDAVAAAIEELRRADSESHARSIFRRLAPWIPVLDRELRLALHHAATTWNLPEPDLSAPPKLAIGETWLLLHAGGANGRVARLAIGSSATPRTQQIDASRSLQALRAVTGKVCRRLPGEQRSRLVIRGGAEGIAITGRSNELAGAVAILSAALGQSADPSVAGSACLTINGGLEPVEHLTEKVGALRRDFPDVRTVVVAKAQEPFVEQPGITIRSVSTLADAFPIFGLDLRRLPSAKIETHRRRAKTFEELNTEFQSPEIWKRRSLDAWETSIALAAHEPETSALCRAWAALFSVHAGDPETARTLLAEQDPLVLDAHPSVKVWSLLSEATGRIDRNDLDGASEAAAHALAATERLVSPDRERLLGLALGTRGRALMHGGRFEDAVGFLQRAAEHHQAHAKYEHARSLCYLATCQRHAGHREEALDVIATAQRANDAHAEISILAETTAHYLSLERGRILLELDDFDAAERCLLAVTPDAPVASYPRLGAERSLVRLRRRAGHESRASEPFSRCLQAARELALGGARTLFCVAAVGLAEGADIGDPLERSAAEKLIEAAFGEPWSPALVARLVDRWIF